MGIKHLAVCVAASAATLIAAPAFPQEFATQPMTQFFVSVPLDASTHKEFAPNFGLQFQGSRPYQTVRIDYQTFKFLPGALAAMEVKYIVAGAVAVGAAVAVAKKDSAKSAMLQQQQAEQKASCTQVC